MRVNNLPRAAIRGDDWYGSPRRELNRHVLTMSGLFLQEDFIGKGAGGTGRHFIIHGCFIKRKQTKLQPYIERVI